MQIAKEVKLCVAFLTFRNKANLSRYVGTAFFVVAHTGTEKEARYLVTARHVIDAVRGKSVDGLVNVRINDSAGGVKEFGLRADAWQDHPDDSVDAAIYKWTVGFDGLSAALIPTTMALDKKAAEAWAVDVGTEVFLTGLFPRHVGRQRNLPIVRIGTIAMMPDESIETESFGQVEAYLIECRSLGGLSGSPVFAVTQASGLDLTSQFGPNPQFFWLGLVHGHWDAPGPVADLLAEDQPGATVNMGIALVVPAYRVVEMLPDSPSLAQPPTPIPKYTFLPKYANVFQQKHFGAGGTGSPE